MTSKYCDNCGHEKTKHTNRSRYCKIKDCECNNFIRGPVRESSGDIAK